MNGRSLHIPDGPGFACTGIQLAHAGIRRLARRRESVATNTNGSVRNGAIVRRNSREILIIAILGSCASPCNPSHLATLRNTARLITPPVQPDGGKDAKGAAPICMGIGYHRGPAHVLAGGAILLLGPRCRSCRSRPEYSQGALPPEAGGLYIHAFAIMFPLIIGPVQFLLRRLTPEARRARYLPLHRWLGRIYVTGALIGGVAGLYLAFYAYGGFVSALGFGFLAVVTLACTSIAYLRIRAGDEFSHKEWMTRSYALIFAAPMLRLLLGVFQEFRDRRDGSIPGGSLVLLGTQPDRGRDHQCKTPADRGTRERVGKGETGALLHRGSPNFRLTEF